MKKRMMTALDPEVVEAIKKYQEQNKLMSLSDSKAINALIVLALQELKLL